MNEVITRYEALKEKISGRWAEFAELMKFVETETEYLTAPASTKFHLCKEEGRNVDSMEDKRFQR